MIPPIIRRIKVSISTGASSRITQYANGRVAGIDANGIDTSAAAIGMNANRRMIAARDCFGVNSPEFDMCVMPESGVAVDVPIAGRPGFHHM
jgi:hypothetical protein